MIDPLKEPVLSLLLSKKCRLEVLPLLQHLPLNDINRPLSLQSNSYFRPEENTPISVLEVFLMQNHCHDNASDNPIKLQIAIELVNQGASLNNKGLWMQVKKPWDILDLAFTCGHYKFVQHLLEGPLQHMASSLHGRTTQDDFTWLQVAVRLNDIDFVKKLLLWGVDCNELSSSNRTALFYVKSPEMLSILLDAGAKVEAVEIDNYGRSLSDHWNRTLTSVDVKKLNGTLFKSLKKSNSLNTHTMQKSWVDSLLISSKGLISDQQKKMKIPPDFTWEKGNLKCSPFVWMAINNTNRSRFQQKKIMSHFVGDPQHMEMGLCDGNSVSNLDVLAFLETALDNDYKQTIGWPDNNLWLEKWMHEHAHLSLSDRLEKMCTTFTHAAILLQSSSWVCSPVAHTGFNWYEKLCSGREGALEPYKSSFVALSNNIAKVSDVFNDCVHKELSKALQKSWEKPITEKLKELAFVLPLFKQKSFMCLYDLMHSEMHDTNIKNITRAFAHETARMSTDFFKKRMYVPVSDEYANEFIGLVDKALNTIDTNGFGILFDDDEWMKLSKVYQNTRTISSTDANYDKWERIKVLMERETISRQISMGVATSMKRKM